MLCIGLLCSAASAQIAYLQFGAAPADMHARAVQLLSQEAGTPVPPSQVIISALDLSGDGKLEMIAYARDPFFCDEAGCEPRIFLFDGLAWRNILEPGLVRTAEVPGAFSAVNVSQTGFSDILAGSLLLVFDGQYYVEETAPEPTELDTAAFQAACVASARTADLLSGHGLSDRAAEFCACTGGMFGQMGMEQQDLDEAMLVHADQAAAADHDLAAILADYELSCRIELTAN